HVALLGHADQLHDAHRDAERRERRAGLDGIAAPRIIVVRNHYNFFDATRLDDRRVLVAPGASAHRRRGGGQPEGGDVVGVLLALDEHDEPLALKFREPVRHAAHAIHLPDPPALRAATAQAEGLGRRPDVLVEEGAVLVAVGVGRDDLGLGHQIRHAQADDVYYLLGRAAGMAIDEDVAVFTDADRERRLLI